MSEKAEAEPEVGPLDDVPLPAEATIYERLVRILAELPAIGKNQRNAQQGFMFRGHDDVMKELNPLLGRHGVVILPRVVERVEGERKTSRGGTMYVVELAVEFEFVGLAGDSITARTWGEGTDSGDKSTSKAHTMAFKSALAVVFAISTEEQSDPDGGTPEETTGRRGRETAPATPEEFDPGKHVREDAPQGEGFQARLAAILEAAGPGVDWRETLAPFVRERFHVETREGLEGDLLSEYWRRLANFAGSLTANLDLTAFPPAVERDALGVLAILAWAFTDGTVPEAAAIVYPTPEEIPADDDVPFGDEPEPSAKQEKLDAEAAEAASRDD